MNRKTAAAIKKYTREGCICAYELNAKHGEGPYTIATQYNVHNVNTTQAANAAIDAGREIARAN